MITVTVGHINSFYDLDHIANDRVNIVRQRLEQSDLNSTNYAIKNFDEYCWVVKVKNIDMYDAFRIIKNDR